MKVLCPYCEKPAELMSGSVVYPDRPDLVDLLYWVCEPCDAYVGCHRLGAYMMVKGKKVVSDGTLPMGRLANAELRRAKQRAHWAFDPMWRDGSMSRKDAYKWLSRALSIPKAKCHIGMFDVAQCRAVVAVVKERSHEPLRNTRRAA